jgi:hypothetical protein
MSSTGIAQPQTRQLNKKRHKKAMKLNNAPDKFQRRVFFAGSDKEHGWSPCGNGRTRSTGHGIE